MSYQDFLISQALMSSREHKAGFTRRRSQRQKADRIVEPKVSGMKAKRIEALRLSDLTD